MKIVIKIGGTLFKNNLEGLYEDILQLLKEGNKIAIVHGGGAQINQVLKEKGLEPRYLLSTSGIKSRHTDEETREAAIMALAGLVNKKMVAGLQKKGINAFGFTGIDGASLIANRKKKILCVDPETSKRIVVRNDYSGKIIPEKVNGSLINLILENEYIPVIGALAIDEDGEILNTDGDRAAINICHKINADVFISVTDVLGVYENLESNVLIPIIKDTEIDQVLEKVKGGMKKKIIAMQEALELGVPRIIITSGLVNNGISDALEGKIGTSIIKET